MSIQSLTHLQQEIVKTIAMSPTKTGELVENLNVRGLLPSTGMDLVHHMKFLAMSKIISLDTERRLWKMHPEFQGKIQ